MKKEYRIAFRVTDQEKKRITVLARQCGLSVSEYVKQRALGYAPHPVLPEIIFPLIEKNRPVAGFSGVPGNGCCHLYTAERNLGYPASA